MIDSELVPWGKGEKHPDKGGEIELKLHANEESEPYLIRVTACFLQNEPTS